MTGGRGTADGVAAALRELEARLAALGGADTATLRALRRGYTKRLAGAGARQVIALASRLLDRGGAARRFVAYELVHHHPGALGILGGRELARLGRGLDGWGPVDAFACYLAGPAWRERQVSDALIRRWTRSGDHWWRRAALVSTVPLNSRARGARADGRGDARRTLAVCAALLADRDDMVVKAMSWALRELAKRDPRAVRGFLARQRPRLAARVVREVEHKLRTGLKNPRRGAAA